MDVLIDLIIDPENLSTLFMLFVLLCIPLAIFIFVLLQMAANSKKE